MGDVTTLYRAFAADGRLLYIGISCNLSARMAYHRRYSLWWSDMTDMSVEELPTWFEFVDVQRHRTARIAVSTLSRGTSMMTCSSPFW